MQNMFTDEHQARILIDTRHAEARRQAILKRVRDGQLHRPAVETVMATIATVRMRLLATVRPSRPVCQPGMAC